MNIEDIKTQCTGCMACYSVCSQKCISITTDNEGFYYPMIDKKRCVGCHKCEMVCHCFGQKPLSNFRRSFYGCSKDNSVLNKSTSGGAFYHLAERTVEHGGKVYGAFFDCNKRILQHVDAEDVGIDALLKSKYVESNMGNTIADIQNNLAKGKIVLFCGTPCQAGGVRKTIPNNKNLLIVDFVCHGIPSAILFKEHLAHLCKNSDLINIDFRPKTKGWENKYLYLKTKRNTKYIPFYLDSYYSGFMEYNAFLRQSCYQCKFRNSHQSDLTIADFWGFREVNPDMNVKKGMSLIVANTPEGLRAISEIKESFDLHEIDNKYSTYINNKKDYTSGLILRDRFYKLYYKHGFEYAANKTYMKNIWKEKIKYTIKHILKYAE